MAPEITKAEREELLAAHARTTRPTRDHLPTDAGDKKLLRDSTLLPRLLRALDAAEAEQKRLRRVLLLLDRITDGREESNGTDPEEIQIVVERFVALKAENAAIKAKLAKASSKVQEMCESIGRIHIADYVTESVEVCEGLDRIRAVLFDSRDVDTLKAKLAALVGPIHMSCDINRQSTLCGVYFLPSVMRTPRRSNVTCGACLAIDDAALAAAKEPQP